MQAPGRKSSIPPTTNVWLRSGDCAAPFVSVSNDCMEWMVTKHVLQNQNHNHIHTQRPARFCLSRVLYLRSQFQLSPGCEILGPRGETMRRLLLITGVMALVLGTASVLQAKEITVRGKLQKTVEAGGWLIVNDSGKYLILNAKNFQNNAWFKEST